MSERSDTSARRDLIPEPDVVERVICGERVAVKCYPPMSDPRWAAWIRDKVRSNSGGFDSDSIFD